MVNIAENGRCRCVVEARGEGGAWGSGVPYGEVLGFRNAPTATADVFLPGLARADAAAALDAGAERGRSRRRVLASSSSRAATTSSPSRSTRRRRRGPRPRRRPAVRRPARARPTSANRVRFLEATARRRAGDCTGRPGGTPRRGVVERAPRRSWPRPSPGPPRLLAAASAASSAAFAASQAASATAAGFAADVCPSPRSSSRSGSSPGTGTAVHARAASAYWASVSGYAAPASSDFARFGGGAA